VLFRIFTLFPSRPAGLPGGKQRKETLHSKASESAAHVAGFGLHLEGRSPPNLPERFFDSMSCLPTGRQLAFGWLTAAGASAAASRAQTAQPLAVDNGDHRRRTAVGDRHAPAA